jgi:phage-related tail protein
MEEDEESMRRANSEVMQMQQQMMSGELRPLSDHDPQAKCCLFSDWICIDNTFNGMQSINSQTKMKPSTHFHRQFHASTLSHSTSHRS